MLGDRKVGREADEEMRRETAHGILQVCGVPTVDFVELEDPPSPRSSASGVYRKPDDHWLRQVKIMWEGNENGEETIENLPIPLPPVWRPQYRDLQAL